MIRQYADDEFTLDDLEQLAEKIDWEGGVYNAIVGYGIRPSMIQEWYGKPLPAEIKAAWEKVMSVESAIREIANWLDNREVTR